MHVCIVVYIVFAKKKHSIMDYSIVTDVVLDLYWSNELWIKCMYVSIYYEMLWPLPGTSTPFIDRLFVEVKMIVSYFVVACSSSSSSSSSSNIKHSSNSSSGRNISLASRRMLTRLVAWRRRAAEAGGRALLARERGGSGAFVKVLGLGGCWRN